MTGQIEGHPELSSEPRPAPIEWWAHGLSVPRWSAQQARIVEDLGFTGYTFNDSQCLGADPFVSMMAAAACTTELKLATSVTNPVTRHPSVTAAAIASLQAESKGRVVLGIGRGDSSLAHLGLAPAKVKLLDSYVAALQALLAGQSITFDDFPIATNDVADVSTLRLRDTPTESRLEWLRPSTPKVPVTVTASGPKVIRVGARRADGINLALGADLDRVAWGVSVVSEATAATGNPLPLGIGAYVSVIVDEDRERARDLVAGEVASFARFSAMHGQPVGPTSEDDAATLERLHNSYDMNHHFQHGSPQSSELSGDFIDRFAIVGPPDYCVERLTALARLGITRFLVSTTPGGVDRTISSGFRDRFAREVMPVVDGRA